MSITLQDIVSHSKEYGFVYPSSELYDGLQAVYDYGPFGVELKRNLKEFWWKAMTVHRDDIVGIDSSILMHPKIWKASGHVDSFNDPMIDNKDSKLRYRADNLVEDYISTLENSDPDKASSLRKELGSLLDNEDYDGLKRLIIDLNIVCDKSKTSNWTDVRQFSLMFKTELGAIEGDTSTIYLRPETAQGIFVNFLNVQKSARRKVPFGIAQIGKAFRNEIVARQFVFRMREFEQMELQYFIRPGDNKSSFEQWINFRLNWYMALGIPKSDVRLMPHEKLAHYADAATDIEFKFPFGFREIEGIHSRGDFDLAQHEKFTGKKIKYYDSEISESYTPNVVETSIGADRLFLAVMSNAYKKVSGDKGKVRTILSFDPAIAPVKLAVLPLVKKDGVSDRARSVYMQLKNKFKCVYEEQASIGKRYTRQDLVGTPFCMTVDHQSLEDEKYTLRFRDSTEQRRLSIDEIMQIISDEVSIEKLLNRL